MAQIYSSVPVSRSSVLKLKRTDRIQLPFVLLIKPLLFKRKVCDQDSMGSDGHLGLFYIQMNMYLKRHHHLLIAKMTLNQQANDILNKSGGNIRVLLKMMDET